uniref:Uncharacterized protein n=1 Tax=Leptocylindrus danicus TaxID=163516 RepID=A0A7S2K5L4_9STRA|mmetsp:Transcript_18188/g.27030  ORF Transcript_18188/g.27030 Transcript_18188/m.27030 type:complete len:595 (+) Transcript_18188:156-1940(+)|eukprot:CAMPEP_0116015178 /NCGR_PEP_ID=MMETSP0321-20121206/6687_1 /TAXON_ID=163516 /ORGANISM="Leptocylindrus danicus var. danicus, Strain B650" /LENGTH=594 /DNA_ID=CAMNT_0003484909 /DNA_START=104 /DNA_END=1888 /DNA_ORIENTATION=-
MVDKDLSNEPSAFITAVPANASYNELLKLVTGLQTELQKTITISRSLKAETSKLKEENIDVKESLLRAGSRFHEFRDALTSKIEDCLRRERSMEEEKSRWKSDIAEKKEEVEKLKLRLLCIENDNSKTRAREEIESEFILKESKLLEEVSKWKEDSRSSKRESELLRMQSDQSREVLENEISSLRALNESAAVAHKKALNSFAQQSCMPVNDQLKKLSHLEVELNKVTITNAELQKEIEEMHKTTEKDDMAQSEILSGYHEKSMDLLKRIADLEGINVELKSENQRLSEMPKEVETKEAKVHGELFNLRLELQEAKIDLRHRTEKMHSDNLSKEKESELKQCELERVNTVLIAQRDELAKALRDAKTEMIEKLRQAHDDEVTTRKEAKIALERLEEKCRHHESLIEKLTQESLRARSEYESNIARIQQERDNCRDDACRIAREKLGLVNRAVDTERESAKLKEEVSLFREKIVSLRKETDALKSELKVASDDKMMATKEMERLQKALKELAHQLNEKDDVFRREVDGLKQRSSNMLKDAKNAMKSEVDRMNQNLSSELDQEKKRSAAYKQKAIEAHEKSRRVHQALEKVVRKGI